MKRYPSYKPSGVEWLGEIPIDWECKTLKRITKFAYGDSLSDENRKGGDVPVYGSNGVVGFHDIPITKAPCIIVGRKGSYGRVNFSEIPCFPIDTSYFIDSTKTNCNLYWLKYFLSILRLDENTVDDMVPGLSREWAYRMPGLIISLFEQNSIVRFLDHKTGQIDRFIANRQKQIELLKEQKAGIINKAVTKGINPNAKMKPSEIEWVGEIPAHWRVWKLKYLTRKIGSGVTPLGGSQVYKTEGVAFFRSQNIYNDTFELSNISFIDEGTHVQMKNSKIEFGDVLLNITGASIGRCYFFSGEYPEANVNQHVCIIRSNKMILFKFLHSVMISEIGQNQIFSKQSGTNREGLNFELLKQFDIPLPSKPEQQRILSYIQSETLTIDTLITKYQKQIDLLHEYRTSLISHVVTGKIDVRGWNPENYNN